MPLPATLDFEEVVSSEVNSPIHIASPRIEKSMKT